jgi:hypothetical protein
VTNLQLKPFMSKNYSSLLLELVPLLPANYKAAIRKTTPDVKKWHLDRAFKGESVPADIMRKIYSKSKKLASRNVSEISNAKKESKEIQSLHRRVA